VLHRTLAVLFGLITLHFLTKPFLASMLGSAAARDYTDSSYAVVSQAGSGILLIATGLVIMLIVIQSIVQESLVDSETDPLSDLLNRRGLDRRCQREFVEGGAVVVLDLDHFKAINDTHGHDVGDVVIVAFADIMRRAAPRGALLARTGARNSWSCCHRPRSRTSANWPRGSDERPQPNPVRPARRSPSAAAPPARCRAKRSPT
jgi:hypothetical protein